MEYISRIEEDNESEDRQNRFVCSSFHPLEYPEFVSHVSLTSEEQAAKDNARTAVENSRAEHPSRRYLPCHYFDLIGGSSTGA